MALYIHNREFAIDFGIEYPQGDVVLEYGTVYHEYPQGDVVLEYGTVYHYGGHCGRELYPYWVRCGRVRHCTFLLKTLH